MHAVRSLLVAPTGGIGTYPMPLKPNPSKFAQAQTALLARGEATVQSPVQKEPEAPITDLRAEISSYQRSESIVRSMTQGVISLSGPHRGARSSTEDDVEEEEDGEYNDEDDYDEDDDDEDDEDDSSDGRHKGAESDEESRVTKPKLIFAKPLIKPMPISSVSPESSTPSNKAPSDSAQPPLSLRVPRTTTEPGSSGSSFAPRGSSSNTTGPDTRSSRPFLGAPLDLDHLPSPNNSHPASPVSTQSSLSAQPAKQSTPAGLFDPFQIPEGTPISSKAFLEPSSPSAASEKPVPASKAAQDQHQDSSANSENSATGSSTTSASSGSAPDPFAVFSRIRSLRSGPAPGSGGSGGPTRAGSGSQDGTTNSKSGLTIAADGTLVPSAAGKSPTTATESLRKPSRAVSKHVYLTAEEIRAHSLNATTRALLEQASVRVAADAVANVPIPIVALLAGFRIKHVAYATVRVDSARRGPFAPPPGTPGAPKHPGKSAEVNVEIAKVPSIKVYANSTQNIPNREKTLHDVNRRIETTKQRAMSTLTQLGTELVKMNCQNAILGKNKVFLPRDLCLNIADALRRISRRSTRVTLRSDSAMSRVYDSVSQEMREFYRNDAVWGRRYRLQRYESMRNRIQTKEQHTINLIKRIATESFVQSIVYPFYALNANPQDFLHIISYDSLTRAALQTQALMLSANSLLATRGYNFSISEFPVAFQAASKEFARLSAPPNLARGEYLSEATLYISKYKNESHAFYLTADLRLVWSTIATTGSVLPTTTLRPGMSGSFHSSAETNEFTLSQLIETVKPRLAIGRGEARRVPMRHAETDQKQDESDSSSSDDEVEELPLEVRANLRRPISQFQQEKHPRLRQQADAAALAAAMNPSGIVKESKLRTMNIPSSASLVDLVAITYGPQEGHITRISDGKTYPWLCFTLHFAPPDEQPFKLYLSARNESEVDMWLMGLQSLAPVCCDAYQHANILWARYKLKFEYYGSDFVNMLCGNPASRRQPKPPTIPESLPTRSALHEQYVARLSASFGYKAKTSVFSRITKLFGKKPTTAEPESKSPQQSTDRLASAVEVAGRRGSMATLADLALLAFDARERLSGSVNVDPASQSGSKSTGGSGSLTLPLSRTDSSKGTSYIEEENPRAMDGEYEPDLDELGIIDTDVAPPLIDRTPSTETQPVQPRRRESRTRRPTILSSFKIPK